MLWGSTLLAGRVARAQLDLTGAIESRGGDPKSAPCDGPRSNRVYLFEPAAVITLEVTESEPHDSYFRIAFDDDGEDFLDPVSIDPINPARVAEGGSGPARKDNPKCLDNSRDHCGESDFCNVRSTEHETVLYDNIDPHLRTESQETYRWTFQLPYVECTRCTLQVIQVMQDPALGVHGPFDGEDDIYHRCIDIQLKKGVGNSGSGNSDDPVKVGTRERAIMCVEPPTIDPSDPDEPADNTAGAGGRGGASAAQGGSGGRNTQPAPHAGAGGIQEVAGRASASEPQAGQAAEPNEGGAGAYAGADAGAGGKANAGRSSAPSGGKGGSSAAPRPRSAGAGAGEGSTASGGKDAAMATSSDCTAIAIRGSSTWHTLWFISGLSALFALRSRRSRRRLR